MWTTENRSTIAEEKLRRVLERLVRKDYSKPLNAILVKSWHREMFEEIVPHPDYAGNFRDKDFTPYCLQDYEVCVGNILGTESERVLEEVECFFDCFQIKIDSLTSSSLLDDDQPLSEDQVSGVVELAAWAHGEWVHIHPFANGNGRTARLIANYVLVKFGFGPALAVRPRPDNPYGLASYASMKDKKHSLMELIIWQLLAQSYTPT